ncbi:ABC transporter ATP-binding protein [Suilimivivens aceti]|uniref:ABC transporter ATP-binding protein n=1 Tax=Suilimivivens aceti TaxID=2981774 RepID=A0ABT2SY82_9FIRM|nr:ABC transporter ATP-binding protein [Suilimivivens aceti]MCU6742964.1 ABC transporter ATP-binding protein [Suilimivivens aceti]SCG94827.1 Lipopolysaccharide export system ATP-binding protein LptB [uncultured Clostridium sp.]
MSELVEIHNLKKSYDKRKDALHDLTLTLPRGRIVGLLGPNGSGKTTLIKLLNGLLVPDGGEILIDGEKPGPSTKAKVSYLPERTYLKNGATIRELLSYFQDFYDDFRTDRAKEMLAALRIEENARIRALSKGTREKVQLILVMSRDASLYILDEPIAGVDPAARDYILRTIITNYNENATVLISTHLITDIENILDEVVFMKEGRLLLQTSVEEIREEKGKSVDAYFREVFAC